MKKRLKNKYLVPAIICLVVFIGLTCVYFLSGFSKENTISYLYVDQDDNIDSIYTKLKPIARTHSMSGFTTLVRHSSYADNIIVGRYAIKPGTSTLTLFRNLKNGSQSPVHLTIPSVRSIPAQGMVMTPLRLQHCSFPKHTMSIGTSLLTHSSIGCRKKTSIFGMRYE